MQQHATTFIALAKDAAGADLPQFVNDAFDAFLPSAWRDGATQLAMLPLEITQRLAALVPRTRLHLIRLVSA